MYCCVTMGVFGGGEGGSVDVCIALCVPLRVHTWVGGVWMEEVREAHTENNTHKVYERHIENNESKTCLQKLN